MAKFRGTLESDTSKTMASRLGKRRLTCNANSWVGGVAVELYEAPDGRPYARIWLNGGSGTSNDRVYLFDGPIDDAARSNLLAKGEGLKN